MIPLMAPPSLHFGEEGLQNWAEFESWALNNDIHFRNAADCCRILRLSEEKTLRVLVAMMTLRAQVLESTAREKIFEEIKAHGSLGFSE